MTQKKHEEEHEETRAKEAAPPQPFPFSGSINEPQTVTLPLPQGTEVPKPSITTITPTECTIGDEDFRLAVTGENFFRDSVINFAGQDEPTTLEENGTLSTGVNMALWQGPDTVPVIIKNGPESSDPVDFTFKEPSARSKKKREE